MTQESPAAPPGQSARNWAIVAHLGPIVLSVLSLGMLGWLAPFVVWLTQKHDHPFAAQQAKESLNFRITLLFAYVVSVVLTAFTCWLIPFPLAVWACDVVFGVIAAMQVSDGVAYRYPFAIRLIG